MRDRTITRKELVEPIGGLVSEDEIVREESEDGLEAVTLNVKRYISHKCLHYASYGFSCFCGNRFCSACLKDGRIWYCEECGVTIGPCHYRKRYDGKVLCPGCWRVIDWKHPGFAVIGGAAFLVGLALALCLLEHIVG